MTARALVGLVVFNLLLLVLGAMVLRSLRVWRAGADLVPLTGLAYMLGVGMLVVVGTTEIVIGVPIGPLSLVLGCLVLLLAAELIVRARYRLGRAEPQARPLRIRLGATLSEHRLAAVGVAIGLVALSSYFVALFRAARVMPAHEWDGWWIWNLRAKAIYFDGNLGDAILAIGPPYSSYPPGLSILNASALEAMGEVDMVTLHLQNWFFALGFAAALIGLLAGRVRAWIALPTVLLVVTLPGLRDEALLFHADALLAYQVALAVVLLLLWLDDRAWWRCAAAGVLLSSALLTKRDGLLFVTCVLVALFAASWLERRWAWPRVTLTAVGIAAVGSIWWIAYRPQLDEAAPSGGASALASDPGRFAGSTPADARHGSGSDVVVAPRGVSPHWPYS